MRNTTMVFPNASKSDSVKMQTPDKPKQLCQTVTVPGAWGRDYAGNLTQTATGAPCQDWSRVRLAGIDFRGVEKNYCRNPADHAGAVSLDPKTVFALFPPLNVSLAAIALILMPPQPCSCGVAGRGEEVN